MGNRWLTEEGVLAEVGRRPTVVLPGVDKPQQDGPGAGHPLARLLCGLEQLLCLPGQCSYLHPRVTEITQPFLWLKGLGGGGVELHSGKSLATLPLPAANALPHVSALSLKDKRAV